MGVLEIVVARHISEESILPHIDELSLTQRLDIPRIVANADCVVHCIYVYRLELVLPILHVDLPVVDEPDLAYCGKVVLFVAVVRKLVEHW